MFAASKTASVSGSAPDAQFNYVTMLLHGDGTNGAQNNTFLDSSTNNFTITRNGNTTQGSFSPYGSNWSNYFDGNGDYLGFPNSGAFTFSTGDFTVEAWIYRVGTGTGTQIYESIIGGNTSSTAFWNLYVNSSNNTISWFGNDSVIRTTSNTITNNNWNHIAVSRSSGTLKIFINGVQGYSASVSTSYSLGSGGGSVGFDSASTGNKYFFGYISNIRVVNGTAVYTSAFTPSTTPLTAITNTSLLTCQSNRFIDNSGYAFTLTVNGNASVQRFNPFGTATAYSTSVIGGSGYFDGTGDYLTAANNSAFQLGTGNFTIECWYYAQDISLVALFGLWGPSSSNVSWLMYTNGSGFPIWYTSTNGSTANATLTSSIAITANAWNHIVIERVSGTTTIYVNGASGGNTATSVNLFASTSQLTIGYNPVGGTPDNVVGYLSDVRIVKGSSVYNGTFTPPTAPLTAVSGTSLLTNYTNGAIFDNAMMNDLETRGNAQISTSVKKYGTGSLAFDGTGDFLRPPVSPMGNLGGNFTIEFWAYLNDQDAQDFVGTATWANYIGASKSGWSVSYVSSLVSFSYQNNNSYVIATNFAGTTLTGSSWAHIAIVRNNGTIKCYVNGVASATTISSSTNFVSTTYGVWVGAAGDADTYGYELNGYLDDVRITNGYARYTANFTAPTAAFPDTGPT